MNKTTIKIIALSMFMIHFNANAKKQKKLEPECFLSGTVELPSHFFKNNKSYVNLYGQTSEIDDNGQYCIKKKAENRNEISVQVFYETNLVLENTLFYKGQKSIKANLSLEQAMAEISCREDVCTEGQIKKNFQSSYIKEYTQKTINRYYNNPEKINYEKILSKMSRQDRNVRNSFEKEIKKESKNNFQKLDSDMRATNYRTFKYKTNDIRKNEDFFLKDSSTIQGLTSQSLPPELVITQWARMAYFFGNEMETAGRFYSKEFKEELKEDGSYHKPLAFTGVYKSKAKGSSLIRSKNDEIYFKKSLKEAEGTFIKQNSVIINKTPTYVNIEFIFEDGSWRMNKFDVNQKYLSSLRD